MQNEIRHNARAYQIGDLAGAFMGICAINQTEITRQVWRKTFARRQLVIVAGDTLNASSLPAPEHNPPFFAGCSRL